MRKKIKQICKLLLLAAIAGGAYYYYYYLRPQRYAASILEDIKDGQILYYYSPRSAAYRIEGNNKFSEIASISIDISSRNYHKIDEFYDQIKSSMFYLPDVIDYKYNKLSRYRDTFYAGVEIDSVSYKEFSSIFKNYEEYKAFTIDSYKDKPGYKYDTAHQYISDKTEYYHVYNLSYNILGERLNYLINIRLIDTDEGLKCIAIYKK